MLAARLTTFARRARIASFLGLLPLCLLSQSFAASDEKASALVFRNARVFDGERVLPRASVVVQGGKIVAVGVQVQVPPNAQIIDATGKTLLPGLLDSHTHVFNPEALKSQRR